MRKLHILGITLALVILLVLAACVPFPFGPPGYQQPFGTGGGMMGGGPGSGMMGGGGPRGGTTGGNWNSPNSSVKLLTIEQAADAVRRYLSTYGGNLVLAEVMEFSQNFYAEVEEKDTGIHATEMLVDN